MNSIFIVVASAKNGVIGSGGKIPWRLKTDMEHFKKTTKGQVVVMGRKTFESIPQKHRPLPQRENVILTRDRNFRALGCTVLHSVEDVLRVYRLRDLYIIGGAEIYQLFLEYCNYMLITYVDTEVEGDTVFLPALDMSWKESIILSKKPDAENEFGFVIKTHSRHPKQTKPRPE